MRKLGAVGCVVPAKKYNIISYLVPKLSETISTPLLTKTDIK
jgi:hypothetical protein